MERGQTVTQLPANVKIADDIRTPNQKRLDEIIAQNDEIITELQNMNKNFAVVGAALIELAKEKSKKVKKSVDKV